jgi:SAM-dependent methyltransferase
MLRRLLGERRFRQLVFQQVYSRGEWGGDGSSDFYSGEGSRGEAAAVYIDRMGAILGDYQHERGRPIVIVDLGCGDFEVGRALLAGLPEARYVGCDIVPELIARNNERFGSDRVSFRQVDIVVDPLPEGDVCLVRQVLQHLSNDEIGRFIRKLAYDRVYVSEGQPEVRTGPVNPDKPTGPHVRFDWATGTGGGIELDKPPFGLRIEEAFTAVMPGHEIILTQRVYPAGRG